LNLRNSSRSGFGALSALAALSLTLAMGVGGCGSGGSSTGVAMTPARTTTAASKPVRETKEASPTVPPARSAFPPPDTEAMEPEAVSAAEAGEAACRGKTPSAVKEEFYAEAEESLTPEQVQAIGRLGKFEAQESTDQSFIAGQLAADVYAATLPPESAQAGYQGCVYALAQGLAPKKKK
jgi:hypothetical protein